MGKLFIIQVIRLAEQGNTLQLSVLLLHIFPSGKSLRGAE